MKKRKKINPAKQRIIKKKKTITKVPEEPKEISEQSKKENNILKWIIISIFLIFGLVIGGYLYTQSQINFDYKDIKFTAIKEGELIFYKTSIPYEQNGKEVPYNFYLRTKPTTLEEVVFEEIEDYVLMKNSIINYEISPDCDGDGVIAFANVMQLHSAIGSKFFKDENATCDTLGRYNYFTLKLGDKKGIYKVGNNCYDIILEDDCDVLEVTEKLMAETIVKYKEFLGEEWIQY